MAGTTVHIALTGGCALYLTPNLQHNAHRNVGICPLATHIRSLEYLTLNKLSSNDIIYVRDQSSHSVN
jgi:hypothetical protein